MTSQPMSVAPLSRIASRSDRSHGGEVVEAEDRLPLVEERDLAGAQGRDLQQEVRATDDLLVRVGDPRSGRPVRVVAEPGGLPRARLDENHVSGADERAGGRRRQADPALVGGAFARDADDHLDLDNIADGGTANGPNRSRFRAALRLRERYDSTPKTRPIPGPRFGRGVNMKTAMRIMILGVALAASTAAVAQTATRPPHYDVKAEVEMKGKVVSLTTIPDWMGKDGVNIALQLPDGSAVAPHVDVATAGFLASFEFPIAVGDELKLKGYWSASADGSPVFLVHELVKNRVTLNVRDPGGQPLW